MIAGCLVMCFYAFCDESSFYLRTCSQSDKTSNDNANFQNFQKESYNIKQHVHAPTQLHEHIIDLILIHSDSNVISNVLDQLDFISSSLLVQ